MNQIKISISNSILASFAISDISENGTSKNVSNIGGYSFTCVAQIAQKSSKVIPVSRQCAMMACLTDLKFESMFLYSSSVSVNQSWAELQPRENDTPIKKRQGAQTLHLRGVCIDEGARKGLDTKCVYKIKTNQLSIRGIASFYSNSVMSG